MQSPPIEVVPFWRADAEYPIHLDDAALPDATDIAVVGAGYTGLNAARVLAAAGRHVTVIDAGPIGAGASSVNGGMVNYGLKAHTSDVFARYGPELGRELWDAALGSIDLVERIVKDEGIDCAFSRSGAAALGYGSRDEKHFREWSRWLETNVDFATPIVGRDDIRTVVGSDRFATAQVDTVGAGLHPARFVYGLAAAATTRGATIVTNTEVRNIERKYPHRYQILTPKGKLTAENVLLATNGYTGPLVPRLQRRVVPIGSYIVVTEPLPRDLAEHLIPHNRMLWTRRRFLNYFRRTPDDRILMGGRNNLATDLDLTKSAGILRRRTVEIFPELADVEFTHSWTGRLGVTFDLMPHIGRIDGMWYALGYGGHGVGIATYLGTEVGRLMTGELERSPFAEIPHPARFFYRGNPWFLPAAARWYRVLDALGI